MQEPPPQSDPPRLLENRTLATGLAAAAVVSVIVLVIVIVASGGDSTVEGGPNLGGLDTTPTTTVTSPAPDTVPEAPEAPAPTPEQPAPTTPSAPTPSNAGLPSTYATFTPFDSTYYYSASLPSGGGWGAPAETEPVSGERHRVEVTGPDDYYMLIDRTPNEFPRVGVDYESSDTFEHDYFGGYTEFVVPPGEIPECGPYRCLDYLLEDGEGGGWAILVTGPDLGIARTIGTNVVDSISVVG